MSVYTVVERDELEAFLGNYSLGELIDYQGISAGIENTNYFVTTSEKPLVLTLFENHTADELGYFLDLMAFLAEHGIPSAHPIADNSGHYLRELNGKPAALVMRLRGTNVEQPSEAQCRALGEALGRMHLAGQSFTGQRDNDRGPHWWNTTRQALADRLPAEDRDLLDEELAFQRDHRFDTLPRGVIHADLFRDNALFEGDTLTGLIDFYYACNDVLLYDVAVTVNDWCSNDAGELYPEKVLAMLRAYRQARPFTTDEAEAWPVMLRAGALRFWLSRLQDQHFPREGELTHIKDPDVFRTILIARKQQGELLHELWQRA
ncbi:MAG: homoserine kinase [Gammaproteobacteria bacterium]|nr:homoserine kinase [Gammaproteobacteria bacterium]MCW8958361.1 homoserine kinase [Gammaproteobacteria bacterium]MCW8972359.1 homoserine kinase [Gammaproteobacteria bacterium]MCW8992609.1 homoserine kinase [Gammaproteobacteria bacterium]